MSDRKRGRMIICLGWLSPVTSSDLPKAGGPRTLCFGLASDGVYMCPPCCQKGGSLLHCPSTLTSSGQPEDAVYFCCTFLGVASTGRYPASCPVKPGLSSPRRKTRRAAIICPTYFLIVKVLSHMETRSPDKLTDDGVLRDAVARQRQEVVEEFEQALRLQIFRAILVDCKQQRLRVEL